MRLAALALVASCAAAATARAETVPIVVAPFAGRCFDAAQLAERVRAQVGDELPVLVGASAATARGAGSHQEVRVRERADAVTVEVVARDRRGRIVGRAERLVPSEVDCATALSIAALMVARAALPLTWREPPPAATGPPAARAAPTPSPPAAAATAPPAARAAPTPSPPAAAATAPPSTSAAPAASSIATRAAPSALPAASAPPSAASVSPTPASSTPPSATTAPAPSLPAVAPTRRAAGDPPALILRGPPRPLGAELAVAAYGAFALDGPAAAHAPGGEFSAGFRLRRFGAAVRAAVDGTWSARAASAAGPITLEVRRLAVAVEAHADVPLRAGALRFAAGPTLPLYLVHATGIPRPRTSVVTSAGVSARILYHLDLGRVFLTAGVSCEVGFIQEELTVTGAGVVARPPLVTLGPLLALGFNL
jgi:hypothetical protein